MKWLTDKSRLEQTDEPNKWLMIDNELYYDDDGAIYLTPRNYKTDNYTIPDWIAWIIGSKAKYDVRPSHIHDFICQYHQAIRVKLTEQQLRRLRYLKTKDNKVICGDIPAQFLELVPFTKWETDCLFKRAMKSTRVIPNTVSNICRGGVFFNFGWLGYHPSFDLKKIYTIEQNFIDVLEQEKEKV